MNTLAQKKLKVARGYTYTYYVSSRSPNAHPNLPVILLVHGFPDSAHMWQYVVPRLTQLPFQLIVPDCLGYAGTDRPLDPAEYTPKSQAQDFMEILDVERIDSVIAVGHDWGSNIGQRVYLFYPDRVAALILVQLGYLPPSLTRFDLDAANEFAEKDIGYPMLAYWEFFTAAQTNKTIEGNAERFWQVLHGDGDEWMRKMFCVQGAMEHYLKDHDSLTIPLKPYGRRPELKEAWLNRIRSNGMTAPLNYYKAYTRNFQYEAEKSLVGERSVVKVPVLYIGSTDDAVCRPDANIAPREAGLLPDFEEHVFQGGHWSPFEIPDQIADAMAVWLTKRFLSAQPALSRLA